MINSIKNIQIFSRWLLSRSPPPAIPEYCFKSFSHMEFDQVQGEFDNLE